MPSEQTASTSSQPVPVQTDGEHARSEMAARMFDFAKANLPKISDTERLPGFPANWDDAKLSLVSQPAVSKAIRVLASLAAQNCWFQLEHFDRIEPQKYLAEINAARDHCGDPMLASRFDTKAESFTKYFESTPAIGAEIREYGKWYHNNVVSAATSVIRYCRLVLGEWLEIIPAENFRELLSELKRLETAGLAAQLLWFGLGEFTTTEAV